MYIDQKTLKEALRSLRGTSGHLLKIWLVLKHMGLREDNADGVSVDTSNSTESLRRLFSFGDAEGGFFVPFAHSKRYMTMKHDASRSIVQTTINRWAVSGSVVTCDPSLYLRFESNQESGDLRVSTGRNYPLGLGIGEAGFSIKDGTRVSLPLWAFSVWYGRGTNIPAGVDPIAYLSRKMIEELNLSRAEVEAVFIETKPTQISLSDQCMTDLEIFKACSEMVTDEDFDEPSVQEEDLKAYEKRIKRMAPDIQKPIWMRTDPERDVRRLIESGASGLLLYGPPRTGKTRLIDLVVPRNDPLRETIQIHDGWNYDNLVEGFRPNEDGIWGWYDGPLKRAIEQGKKYIVLEEANRTLLSQALGELFSLIEAKYRGPGCAIRLRSGKMFHVPAGVIFFMTMNNVDKSTEDLDDALLGRVHAVEVPPSSAMLSEILSARGLTADLISKTTDLFVRIQEHYQLGHGYFAEIRSGASAAELVSYYRTKIRPVLSNHLGALQAADLADIDAAAGALIGR